MTRILLIEDHKVVMSAYETVIRQAIEGVYVTKAYNCKQAFYAIQEAGNGFDLAIVDYNLPAFEEKSINNGGDIIDVLWISHPNCKILLITAYQSAEIITVMYNKPSMHGIAFKSDIFLEKLVIIIQTIFGGDTYYTASVRTLLELE